MKQLILILLSFVAFNITAQEKIEVKKESTKKEHQKLVQGDNTKVLAKTETHKLSKQLNLSSEQQQRVYDIFLEHFEQELKNKEEIKKLINSKDEVNKEEIKQKIAKQKSGYNQALKIKLKEVLTSEQFENYLSKTKQEQKTKVKS
ncbi:hypothetical protein ACPX19_07560 [Winogradskyella sp. HB-48]|uniref:hypothetical protein n=1 Tax=Winogradskyella sp. HB-48 TaxID=3416808 RepID=UPI003CEDC2F4